MSERARLEALLGPNVQFATRLPSAASEDGLFPEERQAVERAVPSRRLEMAAGRDAARDALTRLGCEPVAIVVGDGGAPQWPAGIVGSITHTRDWAVAVVARAADLGAIGIDAEPAAGLEPELWEAISTPWELERLRASSHAPAEARRLFCAKEAAYKCQYPRSLTFLEFEDLEVRWKRDDFVARFTRAAAPFAAGDEIAGRIAEISGHWLAVARL